MSQNGVNIPLKITKEERDLRVIITSDLKPTNNIKATAGKAMRVLYTIRRTLTFNDTNTFIRLYKTLVRPLLEYANSAWSPLTKNDSCILEKVQRRATKLTTLHHRRRGDLIEMLKYTHIYKSTSPPFKLYAAEGR
jgi:hypothetical protein